jgi:hypothetical protein
MALSSDAIARHQNGGVLPLSRRKADLPPFFEPGMARSRRIE